MALQTYSDLQGAMSDWLQPSALVTGRIPDLITLFEAVANRRLRVRQQEAVAILQPQSVVTVGGAASSGSANLIRLTVSSTAAIFTSDQVTVANVVGTTEANGTFTVNVVDNSHIDLLGTTFTNAYVSGGTVTDTGNASLPTDYLAWRSVTWLGNPQRNLDFVEPAIMTSRFPEIPVDLPSEFSIEGSILRVMPQDSTAIKFLYYQKIPALSSGSNWLMTAYPDLYLFGSLTEGQAMAANPDDAVMWKMRRDELFDEVVRLSNRTRGPSNVRVLGPTP